MSDSTITKSKLFKEDIAFADGGTGSAETGTRLTSAGGTLTLTKVDATHLKHRSLPHTVDQAGDHYYDARGYGTAGTHTAISAAQDDIGSDERILYLAPGSWVLTDDLTISANVTLKLPPGAVITVPTGKTLTISGLLDAGLYQIFSCVGTGAVTFGAGSTDYIKPEWWGANSSTDSTDAVNAALTAAAVNKNTVQFSGWYYCESTVNIPLYPNIAGVGMYACGIDSYADDHAMTGTGKISQQYFMNFGVTQANNTETSADQNLIDLQYGANFSLFANLSLIGKAATNLNGFVLRGTHPMAGVNTNQFSNTLLNIRTGTADTEIAGAGIKLYGSGTADARCNNNALLSCCPGGFATGIYVYGQNNLIQSPAFNSLCSTAGVHVDSDANGGCNANVLDAPYFDAAIVAGNTEVKISNETNSDNNRLLYIRSPLPQTFLYTDVTVDGTHSSYTLFSIDDVWYKAASPVGMAASLGTKVINTALDHTWLKTGTDGTTGWTRQIKTWSGVVSVDVGNVAAGAELEFDITPTTVPTTHLTVTTVNNIALAAGLIIRRVYFDGSVIKVTLYNYTGGDIDPAAQNWRYVITEY